MRTTKRNEGLTFDNNKKEFKNFNRCNFYNARGAHVVYNSCNFYGSMPTEQQSTNQPAETTEVSETRTIKVSRPSDTRSKMELYVKNHPDPAAFIAQLKRDIDLCDKPCDKMAIVLKAVDSGYLPANLPFPIFQKEIHSISQQVFSYWMLKNK